MAAANEPAAIVGAGVVTSAGTTTTELWVALIAAKQTQASLTIYADLDDLPVVTARATAFNPEARLERHELRRLDRSHQMAFWAADDALTQAGDGPDPERCAVVVGTGLGAAEYLQAQYKVLLERGPRAVSPLTIPVSMPNSVAAHLALRHGFSGVANTVTVACASGAAAIGEALWLLRTRRADRVLAGGVEAPHGSAVAAFFNRMEAMTSRFDDPGTASRPFDAQRDGLVLGEGAGFVVLEREADAGDRAIGRVLGYGASTDAFHLVAPHPEGAGAAASMRAALADAGIGPADIGHINAHGTSTPRNDLAEARAIRSVFDRSDLPVTANKGVIGHLIGAAGAVEAIVAMMTNTHGIVPPIANLMTADPEIDLFLAAEAVAPTSRVALSNSLGFGGHNATLILG
jgi:3-oxoacyl-[acyl-carrier-protein] synthase II